MKLDDTVRALREEGALAPTRKVALRERIVIRENAVRPQPSRKIAAWVLPIAAALVASTVYAGVSRHWFSASSPTLAPTEQPAPIVPSVLDPEEKIAPLPVPSAIESAAPVVQQNQESVSVHAPPMPAPVPAEDLSLRDYREAERLQRVEKDCARAVPAWDAYLARAGSSPLVVDARYNRAICLVRLGRRDEARLALDPFARGAAGSYRQSEAQSLLDELNGDSSAGH
jgi:hypothetical protein